MNPDGLSYLDLASDAATGGPLKLVNAYWSPGYPALISIAIFLFRPSPDQEFALIHFVNLLIFIFALWSFSFFLRNWFQTIERERGINQSWKYYFTPFAFCTFLWFTLQYIGTEGVTPDLAVAAMVFLAAGLTCRVSLPDSDWKDYVALGLVLGLGYYVKAAMFPLGLILLVLLFLLLPLSGDLVRRKLLASLSLSLLVFLLVAAPLVTALSVRARILTIGEAGRLNYAWFVDRLRWADNVEHPRPYETPNHPAPKLDTEPLTLVFASPIGGTYPLWYDPSYWYAGVKVQFHLRRQITTLEQSFQDCKEAVVDSMAFIAGALVLFVLGLGSKAPLMLPRRSWWQLAWPLAAWAMYALVHVESRFLGAFLVLLWLATYGAVMFRVDRRIAIAITATVLATVLVPFTATMAWESARSAKELVHPKVPDYQIAALALRELGLRSGDRLAVVGYGFDCYYARYDRLRIVAQIPDPTEFWHLSKPELKSLEERLASVGVKAAVVAQNRPDAAPTAAWKDVKLSDSVLSVLLLSPEVADVSPHSGLGYQ